jgi:glycosyltransferase involved in cell wall biosynthesis
MSNVLVLANSVVPLPGLPTNGGGLRAWTLARGLESAGHAVTLLFPRHSLDEQLIAIAPEARAAALPHTFRWEAIDAAIAHAAPDVVVASSWILAGQIRDCPAPLVVDLAGPLLLEFLAQDPAKGAALAHLKTAALARADYVICAGERQRPYFAPWLLLGGFTPADCLDRLGVVPIGCDPQQERHAPPNAEPRFLFAGMVYAWQDPLRALRATLAAIERHGRGRLIIHADFHPVHSQGAAWFAELRALVADHPRVALGGVLPYDALLAAYREADLALDLYARTLERELAFNTRTVDFLHAGLPPLYADYAELSPIIRDYGAGFVVPPDDDAAIATALDLVFTDPAGVAARGWAAGRLARERLAWDRTIAPLAAFCAAPTRRQPGPLGPRALVPELVQTLTDTRTELANTRIAADDRRDYAARVEAAWAEQGARLTERDTMLAAWRRRPWRMAARQTLAGVRARLTPKGARDEA